MVLAPLHLLRQTELDYLTMDYLAEVTMSILHKQMIRDSNKGWATDLQVWLEAGGLSELRDKDVRLVTNAGGANPHACAKMVLALARTIDWWHCRVAIVDGDDMLALIGSLEEEGTGLSFDPAYEVDRVADAELTRDLLSANAYLGGGGVARALELGADIVITGRVADASLITGCMLHAAGWAGIAEAEGAAVAGPVHAWAPESVDSPLDVLAAWTVAGHLIECGAQVTGGNATDWATIEDLANVGYPIAEVGFDGSVVISKPENTGGVVNRRVVAEQLLYEIGDPSAYITPDAIIDITEVTLTEIGKDRVEMKGARGLAPTPWLKVSACRIDGWFAASELIVPGQDCLARAQRMDEVLRARLEHLTELHIHTEYLGAGALSPPALRPPVELFEVVVRWAASSPRRGDIETFGMAIAPLVLTSPAGVSGMGARARPRQQLRFIPLLVKRGLIEQAVRVRTFQSRAGRLADRHNWIEDSMFSRLQRMSERRNEHRLRGRLAEGLLRRLVEPAEEEVRH
jgi:hypothetical protein